jgi:hypothetical protein
MSSFVLGVPTLLAYLVTAALVWVTNLVIYRRFFHPLAMIPGPFWPSITHYYVVKYNLFSGRSQFYLQVEKLHQQYAGASEEGEYGSLSFLAIPKGNSPHVVPEPKG